MAISASASRVNCHFILAAELARRIVLSFAACQAKHPAAVIHYLFASVPYVALALLSVYQAIDGV